MTLGVITFWRAESSPKAQAIPTLPDEGDEDEWYEDGDGAGGELDSEGMDWGVVTATVTAADDVETEGGDRALHRALPEDRLTGERRAAICW